VEGCERLTLLIDGDNGMTMMGPLGIAVCLGLTADAVFFSREEIIVI
jgi:hypothetical protein